MSLGIHQRHCCCPSSSYCLSPLPPFTYSVLLLSVTKEMKGRGHKYLFSRPQSSVQHLYSRSCGKYGKGFRQSRACVAQAASLLAYLPSFSSVSLHFLLPLLILALTDYNLNLLPGRDSLGNNTKSLCGKLCDFSTNSNHSRHYFSSW